MKNSAVISLLFTLFLPSLWSNAAHAWGERGHNMIGFTAAQLTKDLTTTDEQAKLGGFFTTRAYALGHLSNIPDISWKDKRFPTISSVNSPNHFFDSEIILGKYDKKESKKYLDSIRNLEPDIDKFMAQYNGKPSPLDAALTIDVADDVGSAPFRTEQLYNKMVEALKCAKGKEVAAPAKDVAKNISKDQEAREKARKEEPKFREPIQNGAYACTPNTSRSEDIFAAVEIGGIMGHFVGDLSMPYHTTVDHDGYSTGQGGIHAYFETFLLNNYDDKILSEVQNRTHEKSFQKNVWAKQIQLKGDDNTRPATLMFHLAADSFGLIDKVASIDKQTVVKELGDVVAVTDKRLHHFKGKEAKRLPDDSPVAMKAYRSFIVDRLSTSSYLLASLWVRAWREAGSPDLHSDYIISTPYPMNPPFILPPKALYEAKADKLKLDMNMK